MSNIFNIELRRSRFTALQKKLLQTLRVAEKPLSMRQLEEKLEKKRLTLLYNLRVLEKIGWVKQDRTRPIYAWALNPADKVQDGGEVSIDSAYEMLAKTPRKRLWGMQGAGAIQRLIQQMQEGTSYKPIHARQRLRQVIIDGIITVRGMELIKRAPKKELASHLHRPTILHVATDTPQLTDIEIITDGKILCVIDRERGRASITDDSYMVAAYLGLHETIAALSTKVSPQEVYGEDSQRRSRH